MSGQGSRATAEQPRGKLLWQAKKSTVEGQTDSGDGPEAQGANIGNAGTDTAAAGGAAIASAISGNEADLAKASTSGSAGNADGGGNEADDKNGAHTAASESRHWEKRVTIHGTYVYAKLASAGLKDSDLESFFSHMNSVLEGLLRRTGGKYASDVDISRNSGITDEGVERQLVPFLKKWPACHRLKLHHTSISDRSLRALSKWISEGHAWEVHLSHMAGRITAGVVYNLLHSIYRKGKYPLSGTDGCQHALWLRMEHNRIEGIDDTLSRACANMPVRIVGPRDVSRGRVSSKAGQASPMVDLVYFYAKDGRSMPVQIAGEEEGEDYYDEWEGKGAAKGFKATPWRPHTGKTGYGAKGYRKGTWEDWGPPAATSGTRYKGNRGVPLTVFGDEDWGQSASSSGFGFGKGGGCGYSFSPYDDEAEDWDPGYVSNSWSPPRAPAPSEYFADFLAAARARAANHFGSPPVRERTLPPERGASVVLIEQQMMQAAAFHASAPRPHGGKSPNMKGTGRAFTGYGASGGYGGGIDYGPPGLTLHRGGPKGGKGGKGGGGPGSNLADGMTWSL